VEIGVEAEASSSMENDNAYRLYCLRQHILSLVSKWVANLGTIVGDS
jgi:hypothetical protein